MLQRPTIQAWSSTYCCLKATDVPHDVPHDVPLLHWQVGLWDVDHQAADSDDDGFDGVLMFEPHRDYISSLKWLGPSGAALMTGSYDGVVRRLDVESGEGQCDACASHGMSAGG